MLQTNIQFSIQRHPSTNVLQKQKEIPRKWDRLVRYLLYGRLSKTPIPTHQITLHLAANQFLISHLLTPKIYMHSVTTFTPVNTYMYKILPLTSLKYVIRSIAMLSRMTDNTCSAFFETALPSP